MTGALPRLDVQHGQSLWLPLLTLHIHAIATLSPILQVGFFFLLLFSAFLVCDALGCRVPLPDTLSPLSGPAGFMSLAVMLHAFGCQSSVRQYTVVL